VHEPRRPQDRRRERERDQRRQRGPLAAEAGETRDREGQQCGQGQLEQDRRGWPRVPLHGDHGDAPEERTEQAAVARPERLAPQLDLAAPPAGGGERKRGGARPGFEPSHDHAVGDHGDRSSRVAEIDDQGRARAREVAEREGRARRRPPLRPDPRRQLAAMEAPAERLLAATGHVSRGSRPQAHEDGGGQHGQENDGGHGGHVLS
jgi:hypothetical protein